jgi:hypothetical protein
MKPILHFKFSMNSNDRPPIKTLSDFANHLKETLGNDYYCILTPFELTNPTNDAIIFNFDGIDYSYEEIKRIIDQDKVINTICSIDIT